MQRIESQLTMRRYDSRTLLLLLSGLAATAILLLIIVAPLRVNRDAALFLLLARRLLQGDTPYVDFVEINLPLISYISVIPVLIAQVLSTNPIPVFLIMASGLIAWSAFMSARLTVAGLNAEERVIAAAMTFGIALESLRWFLSNEFGQREQILFALFLPYLILRWLRHVGEPIERRTAILIGFVGGIGICLKPQFVPLFLAIELYWLITEHSFERLIAPETVGLAAFGIIYAGHFLLVPAEMRNGLFDLLGSTWWGYHAYGDYQIVDLLRVKTGLIVIGLAPFVIRRNTTTRVWKLLQSLGIFVLTAVFIFGFQGRGYFFHSIPAHIAATLMVTIAMFSPRSEGVDDDTEERLSRNPDAVTIPRLLLLLFLLVLYLPGIYLEPFIPPSEAELYQIILEYTEEHDGVLLQSTIIDPYALILQTNRTFVGTYIPALPPAFAFADLEYGPDAYTPTTPPDPLIVKYLADLAEDVCEGNPSLVIVDNEETCFACPESFSLWEFLYHRGFIESSLTPTYVRVGEIDQMEVYRHVGAPASMMESAVSFDDAISLTAWELQEGDIVRPCQQITLRSWWEAETSPDHQYSIIITMTGEAHDVVSTTGILANFDASRWHEGSTYVDERSLEIPCGTSSGAYPLQVGILDEETGATVNAATQDGAVIGESYLLTTLIVE